MKFYGHAEMQQNQLRQASLQASDYFPATPVTGEMCFVQKVVYICVEINGGIPVWVPLTREVEMYPHTQIGPSTVWTIQHNLNTTFVHTQCFDNNNYMILPNLIQCVDANTVQVTFNVACAGRAVVLSGSLDGNVKPTIAFEWTQTTPASNWVILHNLGYQPLVRLFIGNNEVQPGAIVHNSVNQVTVSFSSPQTGVARLI